MDSPHGSNSERSYDYLHTRSELLKHFYDALHSPRWLYVCCCAYFIIYWIDTYTYLYDRKFQEREAVYALLVVFNIIVILECIAGALRLQTKRLNRYKEYGPQSMWMIVDVLSLYSVFYDLRLYQSAQPFDATCYIHICLITARNYKLIFYNYIISTHDNVVSLKYTFLKYVLIYLTVLHSSACVWQLSCPECMRNSFSVSTFYEHRKALQDSLWKHYERGDRDTPYFTSWELYTYCLYFVCGTISNIGFGSPSPRNDFEQMLVIVTMLITQVLHGVIAADLTILFIQSQLTKLIFSSRLQLISQYLLGDMVSRSTRTKVINYYLTYWARENALNIHEYLYLLPHGLREAVICDKYWFAVNQASLFYDENVAFKRTIAQMICTEYYNMGDVIIEQNSVRNKMIYVASGSISILCDEDAQSSILSLGVGACIGDTCLLFSSSVRYAVVAESYCVLHVLHKRVLWRMANVLKYISNDTLSNKLRVRIRKARNAITQNSNAMKPLRYIQLSLRNEQELGINDVRNRYKTVQFEQPYDSYILNTVRTLERVDDIFFRTTWPWMLWERSSLLFVWDTYVTIVTLVMLFKWPYRVFFERDHHSPSTNRWRIFLTFIFSLDVIIQLFTVVETEVDLIYRISDIFNYRSAHVRFYCDVLAALPLEFLVFIVFNSDGHDRSAILQIGIISMRLLKLVKVVHYFGKLEERFLFIKTTLFKLLGHFFALFCVTYVGACIQYAITCQQSHECQFDSWMATIKTACIKQYGEEEGEAYYISIEFLMIFHYTSMIITQTQYTAIRNLTEMQTNIVLPIIAQLVYCYLIADYSALISLTDKVAKSYKIMLGNVDLFITKHRIRHQMRARTFRFLQAQWYHNRNAFHRQLMFDCPEDLFIQRTVAFYMGYIKQTSLFMQLDHQIRKMIAARCEMQFFASGDIINYAGVYIDFMYIIADGYCEIVHKNTTHAMKVLSPGTSIFGLEMLLDVPFGFDFRATTDVRLVKICRADIMYAFSWQPHIKEGLQMVLDEFRPMILKAKQHWLPQHYDSSIRLVVNPVDNTAGSWYVFPSDSSDPIFIDYLKHFNTNSLLAIFQYVLMRRTIIPNGSFIYAWEICRSLVAWYCCMYYPAMYAYDAYTPNFQYVGLISHCFLLVDVYLQMHVCYYNAKGLLVSHPYFTAKNYIQRYLLVEFFGWLPLHTIVSFLYMQNAKGVKLSYKTQLLFTLNKFLLLIRSRCLVYEKKLQLKQQVSFTIVYFIFILFAIFNGLATILLVFTADFEVHDDRIVIILDKNSWITDKTLQFYNKVDVTKPLDFYIVVLRWVAMYTLTLGFEKTKMIFDKHEKVFTLLCCLFGYFFFVLIMVYVANAFYIDRNITTFNANFVELKKFMKKQKIPKFLFKRVCNHYIHVWDRTLGISSDILRNLPDAMRQDYGHTLYGNTIHKSLPFVDCDLAFKRMLGMNLYEWTFLHDYDIYRHNSILDRVYFVHSGEVDVYSADGTHLDTLFKGSIFGNFDEVAMVRSMITVHTKTNAVVLSIKTMDFYKIVRREPVILHKMQSLILTYNLHYIKSVEKQKVRGTKPKSTLYAEHLFEIRNSPRFIFINMLAALFAYFDVTYYITFPHSSRNYLTIISTDLLAFFKLVLLDVPCLVFTFKRPRRWKHHRYWLFADVVIGTLSVVPIEYTAYLISTPYQYDIFMFLHLNRGLRLYHIFTFFQAVKYKYVGSVIIFKGGPYLCHAVVIIHTGVCIFYLSACYNNVCKPNSWVYWHDTFICNTPYICSLFYTLSMLTSHGHSIATPASRMDTILALLYATISKFLMASVIGMWIGVNFHMNYQLIKFEEKACKLLSAAKRSGISQTLYHRILRYIHQIWMKSYGIQYPVMLKTLPDSLRCQVNFAAFGHHVIDHVVFANCHIDFLRQLVIHLEMQTYFSGDTIIEEGDINGTMYFINTGCVEVVTVEGSDEVIVNELEAGESYGIEQGLYRYCKHEFTYRAIGHCEILTLKLNDWRFLFKLFPSARHTIYETLKKPQRSTSPRNNNIDVDD